MTLIADLSRLWLIAVLSLPFAHVGETQMNSQTDVDVPFPPARPTAENIAAICYHGRGRPTYPLSFFQGSGPSHLHRCAKAINRLESWFSLCCRGFIPQQSTKILCCTRQAWKQVLSQFCVDEYSTMTLPYECCAERGEARWVCFDSEVPNPNYNPTPGHTAPPLPRQPGFNFNANAC